MLRTAALELRSRRSWIHLAAYLIAFALCCAISSIQVPSAQIDAVGADDQHLAYGYLYFPVLVAPIVASWLDNPFSQGFVQGFPRLSRVAVAWASSMLVLVVLSAAVVALAAGESGDAAATVENAIWVVGITVVLRGVAGSQWASLGVVAYGTLGLFSPAVDVLLVNREPRTSDLLSGLVVVAVAFGLMTSPRTARLLV